jgi:hypothetical protein
MVPVHRYVHKMIAATWADETLHASATGGSANFHIAAQRSKAKPKELVMRLVNGDGGNQTVMVSVTGVQLAQAPCTMESLSVRATCV